MPTGKMRFFTPEEQERYHQGFINELMHLDDLRQKWLPERGIAGISSEDVYRVMKSTGMTWDEIQHLTYTEFQRLKERR